jgi:hypothetical protein
MLLFQVLRLNKRISVGFRQLDDVHRTLDLEPSLPAEGNDMASDQQLEAILDLLRAQKGHLANGLRIYQQLISGADQMIALIEAVAADADEA